MKVLQCHNYYQQPGGEDRVLAQEKALLERRGHDVEQYVLHNDDVARFTRLRLLGRSLYSFEARDAVRAAVERFRPDVVHVHNTLPLMSPAIYAAARSRGAAVVQTLHNYRMICPGAYCQRDGQPCELCVTRRVKWPAVRHACYRDSRPATATIVSMLALHGALGTYHRHIDRFLTCSDFARVKMIEAGFDPARIACKPNFLMDDLGVGAGDGGYALYLGRLSPEKGIGVMLDAWDDDTMTLPLHVIGSGPMAERVREVAGRRPAVTYLGHCPWPGVVTELQRAAVLVFPSVNYEGMPMTLLEAMQAGTPVIGSRLGAIPEIVIDGLTGRCVAAGDPEALRAGVRELIRDPHRLAAMRGDVRRVYAENYTPDAAYQRLMTAYEAALRHRHGGPVPTPRPSPAAVPPAAMLGEKCG